MKRRKKLKVIDANRIVLRSPKGKIRAWMDASSEDLVTFNLFGEKSSLALAVDPEGNLHIDFQKDGRVLMSMGTSDDMGAGMTVSDSSGAPVCFVFVAPDGVPRIRLFHRTSQTRGKKIWETPTPKMKITKRKRAQLNGAPKAR